MMLSRAVSLPAADVIRRIREIPYLAQVAVLLKCTQHSLNLAISRSSYKDSKTAIYHDNMNSPNSKPLFSNVLE